MGTTAAVQWPGAWCGLRTVPAGIDPDAPALVCLVRHEGQAALGISVVGARSNQLDELESLGWHVVQCWWFDLGFDALEVEERLIDRWGNLFSLRPRLDLDEMPRNGSTTAVAASWTTERDAIRFVEGQRRGLVPIDAEQADAVAVVAEFPDPWLLAS